MPRRVIRGFLPVCSISFDFSLLEMLHLHLPSALEAVCEIHEWIGIILPWRDGFQKAATKKPRTTESRRDTFVDLILSADVDFLADVPAGCIGIRGDGDRTAACLECVIHRCQP